jgi:hypothetical protein
MAEGIEEESILHGNQEAESENKGKEQRRFFLQPEIKRTGFI